jgi:methylmalonyl-CoA mutase
MGKRLQANGERLGSLRNRTAAYFRLQGRRPRILITRISPHGSGRRAKRIATAFADMGFDVDINLSVLPPIGVARIAVENDVHAIGLPCARTDSEPFITELLTSLSTQSDQRILVVVWISVQWDDVGTSIQSGDGNVRIFDPETGYGDCASQILDTMECDSGYHGMQRKQHSVE